MEGLSVSPAQAGVKGPTPWRRTAPRAPRERLAPRRHRLLLPPCPWPTAHVCLPFPTHPHSSLGLCWDTSSQEAFLTPPPPPPPTPSQHRHPGGFCRELWEGREGLSPVSCGVGTAHLKVQDSPAQGQWPGVSIPRAPGPWLSVQGSPLELLLAGPQLSSLQTTNTLREPVSSTAAAAF